MTYRGHVKHLAMASALALVTSTIAFSSSAHAETLDSYLHQQLTWTTCNVGECATLKVPLDYSNLGLGNISLAVSRAKHTGPTFQGSLVVNPGGPGSSGLDFAKYVARDVTPSVAKEFDIIGFDPRGVGKSTPVTCMTNKQTAAWLAMDATPDTPAEIAADVKAASNISAGCLKYSARIAPHVGTPSAAQDLDLLRSALGEERLNWLGFSYGTSLGTAYLEAFPDRVGRFVLDGAVDPNLNGMQLSLGQAKSFQRAFQMYAQDCVDHSPCSIGNSRAIITKKVNTLLAALDTRPLRTDDGVALTQSSGVGGIFTAMYSTDMWPLLTDALAQAFSGNGTGLLELSWMGSDQTGPETFGSNLQSAYFAINCWDLPATPKAAGLAVAARNWAKNTPVPEISRSMAWSNSPCSYWFAHNPQPRAPAKSTTTAPVLIVGTLFDPATPYVWAKALHSQLPTSTLLTYAGNGHTAFGSGSRCIDGAVNDYLLKGTLPAAGKSCPIV
jgi:pimeloyl-ACP methyl ester carboxylesterase